MAITVTPTMSKGRRFPVLLVVFIIAAVAFGLIAFQLFIRQETVPPVGLLDKFLPRDTAIRQVEAVTLDVGPVINHPVFETLRQFGPLPLQVPETGKENPFL